LPTPDALQHFEKKTKAELPKRTVSGLPKEPPLQQSAVKDVL